MLTERVLVPSDDRRQVGRGVRVRHGPTVEFVPMTVDIEELDASGDEAWESFVAGIEGRFAYPSLRYRRFLCDLLPSGTPRYLVNRRGGEVVGVLPAFVDRSDLATVVTALPFHCSNGGALAVGDDPDVVGALLDGFRALAAESDAATSSIVTNPFGPSDALHRELFPHDHADPRTGQWTTLPAPGDDPAAPLSDTLRGRDPQRRAQGRAIRRGGPPGRVRGRLAGLPRPAHAEHGPPRRRPQVAPHHRRSTNHVRRTRRPRPVDRPRRRGRRGRCAHRGRARHRGVLRADVQRGPEKPPGIEPHGVALAAGRRRAGHAHLQLGRHAARPGGRAPLQEPLVGHRLACSVLTAIHDPRILDRTASDLVAAHPHSYVAPFPLLAGEP